MREIKEVRLPPPPKWIKIPHIGITLLALSAGAGELYGWPRLHALFGLSVAWLLIPAALLQLPLLVECQRIAILTGESFLVALLRVSKYLGAVIFFLVLISFFWLGGWIAGSAYGLSLLFGFPAWGSTGATLFWTVILIIIFILPLLLGRFALHKYLHRILMIFAVLTFLFCIAVIIADKTHWNQIPVFLKSMISPKGWVFGGLSLSERTDVILAITFMGMGGWACILYTSLSSLGRYGIAGARKEDGTYIIKHPTALRASVQDKTNERIISDQTENSRRNLKKWMNLSWIETSVGVIGNLITTSILAFLAFTILYGSGVIPGANWDLISAQSKFFEPILGSLAFVVFVVLATSFLLDTWIGFGFTLSQMYSEFVRSISTKARNKSINWWFYAFLSMIIIQTIVTIVITPLTPGILIRITAVCMNISTPILCGLLIYMNYIFLPKRGPKWYRPKFSSLILIIIVGIAYMILAVWYLGSLIAG